MLATLTDGFGMNGDRPGPEGLKIDSLNRLKA